MAAVLYLLGLISIVLGAIVAADQFVDTYSLGLSLSVAYQAVVGGILLFVMARLLQHAAATARNTEKFYQQVLQNPGASAALTAAAPVAVAAAADAPSKPEPKVETPVKAEPAPEKPAEPAAPTPAPEASKEAKPKEAAPTDAKPAEAAPAEAKPADAAPAEAKAAEAAPAEAAPKDAAAPAEQPDPEVPAAPVEAEPTIVEQLEYRGYMIDKLSNGKVDVHTAEGPMQFESLETFQRELELSNG